MKCLFRRTTEHPGSDKILHRTRSRRHAEGQELTPPAWKRPPPTCSSSISYQQPAQTHGAKRPRLWNGTISKTDKRSGDKRMGAPGLAFADLGFLLANAHHFPCYNPRVKKNHSRIHQTGIPRRLTASALLEQATFPHPSAIHGRGHNRPMEGSRHKGMVATAPLARALAIPVVRRSAHARREPRCAYPAVT